MILKIVSTGRTALIVFFPTKSAYLAVKQSPPPAMNGNFNLVWRWPGPERIRVFLWKVYLEILLTNAERARRHISTFSLCSICGGADESLLHTFRDCNRIMLLWNCLEFPFKSEFFRISNWREWLDFNLSKNRNLQLQNWNLMFGIFLDTIWFARNEVIFANKSTSFRQIFFKAQGRIQSSI